MELIKTYLKKAQKVLSNIETRESPELFVYQQEKNL
jgi:hypothetical protein